MSNQPNIYKRRPVGGWPSETPRIEREIGCLMCTLANNVNNEEIARANYMAMDPTVNRELAVAAHNRAWQAKFRLRKTMYAFDLLQGNDPGFFHEQLIYFPKSEDFPYGYWWRIEGDEEKSCVDQHVPMTAWKANVNITPEYIQIY